MSKHTHASGASQAGQAPGNLNPAAADNRPPAASLDEREINDLAYQLWQQRGCPDGSADDDWLRAEETLRARSEACLNPDIRARKARAAGV